MRPATQVDPIALAVEADLVLLGNARDDLCLVDLAQPLEELHCIVARHHPARDFLVSLRQLVHPGLDGGDVLGREGTLEGEVVVEAILDNGTDGHLGFGEQLLHGLGQKMRGRVADDLQAVRVLVRDNRQLRIGADDVRGIDQLPVDATGERGLAQACTNIRGNLVDRYGVVEGALTAIRQGDDGHGEHSWQQRPRAPEVAEKRGRSKSSRPGSTLFPLSGSREWDRTTDHLHVKEVLYH